MDTRSNAAKYHQETIEPVREREEAESLLIGLRTRYRVSWWVALLLGFIRGQVGKLHVFHPRVVGLWRSVVGDKGPAEEL